jgi:hypothetical protein
MICVEISLPPEASAFEIIDEKGESIKYETLGRGTQELINTSMSPKELRASLNMVNEGRLIGLGIRAFSARRIDTLVHGYHPGKR